MLRCKDIVSRSSEYLDDHLSLRERLAYRFHLFLCVRCRRFLRHFRMAIGVSARCASKTLPPEQADAISQGCRDGQHPP